MPAGMVTVVVTPPRDVAQKTPWPKEETGVTSGATHTGGGGEESLMAGPRGPAEDAVGCSRTHVPTKAGELGGVSITEAHPGS